MGEGEWAREGGGMSVSEGGEGGWRGGEVGGLAKGSG